MARGTHMKMCASWENVDPLCTRKEGLSLYLAPDT